MKRNRFVNGFVILCLLGGAATGACSNDDDAPPAPADGGAGGEAPEPDYPQFTGPGLKLTVLSVKVSDSGKAVVEFKIADDLDRALDLNGVLTEGAVTPNFILSRLKENEQGESEQYVAYTLRNKGTEEEPVIQSATDANGTYEKIALGHYRYTLGTKVEIKSEWQALTHTAGVYATRDFDEKTYVADEIYSWVPDGSKVETVLDVVNDAACNSCHTRLEFHGGSRRGTQMCNLCHTEENSINPGSGNTIDFQVMIHKIHMGASLPSVVAGEKYFFIGYGDHEKDYSQVTYPWDMRDCSNCHEGSQGERWMTRPSEKPCASCHDRTYFGEGDAPAGWTKHTAGPRDDSECHVCHGEDSLEPISATHFTSLTDPTRPEVVAKILKIENTAPGQKPELEFTITVDGQPLNLLATPLNRLRLKIWGPNTDPTVFLSEELTTAVECATSPVAPCLEREGNGFIYHLTSAIPADAKGSYQVGLDGRYDKGGVYYPFKNPILPFAVTGDLMLRREIVSLNSCNSCHGDLAPHGGSYNQVAYCLNCHNPGAYSDELSGTLAPGEDGVLQAINFKDLIHRLHSNVGYPAPLNDCQQCHLEGTYEVPLAEGLLPSTYALVDCDSANASCDGMGGAGTTTETPFSVMPESAACTSCHSSTSTAAHAETNTGVAGEACATCHGPAKTYDVVGVHALEP